MYDLGNGMEFVGVLRPQVGYYISRAKKTHAICQYRRRGANRGLRLVSLDYYFDLCGNSRTWRRQTTFQEGTDRNGLPIEVDCKNCRKILKKYLGDGFMNQTPDWEV